MYRGRVESAALVVVVSGNFAFGIEIGSGMTRWAYKLEGWACRAVVAGERVYVAGRGELACLVYGTGVAVWHVRTDIGGDVNMLVDGENVFLGAQGRVSLYGPFGERLWGNDLGTGDGVGFAVPGFAQQIDLR
jgi:outer membrane protein assembly factor BamB